MLIYLNINTVGFEDLSHKCDLIITSVVSLLNPSLKGAGFSLFIIIFAHLISSKILFYKRKKLLEHCLSK